MTERLVCEVSSDICLLVTIELKEWLFYGILEFIIFCKNRLSNACISRIIEGQIAKNSQLIGHCWLGSLCHIYSVFAD